MDELVSQFMYQSLVSVVIMDLSSELHYLQHTNNTESSSSVSSEPNLGHHDHT